ncbi:hypothetical protein HDU86_007984 [Geranomyces michiganensis]|nr:hypothetical protein HDU86_007984 [Geranomyces michiganensis]
MLAPEILFVLSAGKLPLQGVLLVLLCDPYPFGPVASNFSIFVSGSVNITSSPQGIEGRIGAASQIRLRSCTVGKALPPVSVTNCFAANQYPNVLLAGGPIDITSGSTVTGGHIVSGSTATSIAPAAFSVAASYACKIKVDKAAVDYAAVTRSISQFSTQLLNSPVTTRARAASGSLTIPLTAAPVEYVELSASLLPTARSLYIDETAAALGKKMIIITIANAPTVTIDRLDTTWLAGIPTRVVWNFVNVGTINIKSSVIWGTLLAPGSQIVGTAAGVHGHVFAASVSGEISVAQARFLNSLCAGVTGTSSSAASTPTGATSAPVVATSPSASTSATSASTCNLPLWTAIADAIVQSYGSVCSDDARSALRLAYSDSATFSIKNTTSPGGADGSAVLAAELAWPENKGLQKIATTILALQTRFSSTKAPVSRADLIQLAAALAVVTCFPGPSVPFQVGRPDAKVANPEGRLPDVFDTADNLLAAFADMGFNATETVALMGAHSIGKQRYVDVSHQGAPLDSSPNEMDAQYYADALQDSPPPGTFRLPSDHKLARNIHTKVDWDRFAHDPRAWSAAFSAAMSKMSALGVRTPLVACPVIPAGPQSLNPTSLGSAPAPAIVINGLAVCDMNIWANVHNDISLIVGPVCSDVARAAIKLAYMDAATWSDNFGNGGADGSIMWFAAEQGRRENAGLAAIIAALAPIPTQRKVSAADVIQLAAAYSIQLCTPGPLLTFKVGRADAVAENPSSRIPSPTDSAETLLARFADMGFTPEEFIALLGAHSTAKNRYTNITAFGVSLDSTVNNFDNQYYRDMLAPAPPVGTSPLRSDRELARNARTAPIFSTYATDSAAWITQFSSAWDKLSSLGVPPTTLVNCPVLALSTEPVCNMDLWTTVRNDILRDVFEGKCNDNAKRAIRLMFHDAGTYSRTYKDGGADGSLLLFPSELARPDNAGLEEVVEALIPIVKKRNVGAADVTQLSGALATVICDMGPQMPFRVGRYDAVAPNPENRLPNVHDTVDNIVARFLDMDPRLDHIMVSALLGAHSTGKQRHTDLERVGFPLDTTPDVWDILYYSEAMQDVQGAGTARLPVDYTFGHDPKTRPVYRFYSVNEDDWNKDFVAAMDIVADLGVTHTLQVCPVIPPSTNPFSFGMKEF